MLTAQEQAVLDRYVPLIQAELRRIGVTEEDERWIHAGSGGSWDLPLEQMLTRELAALRTLPTGLGVVGYCAYLGFDYATAKAGIFGVDPGAA